MRKCVYHNLHPAQGSQDLPKVREYLTSHSHQEVQAVQGTLNLQEHLKHKQKHTSKDYYIYIYIISDQWTVSCFTSVHLKRDQARPREASSSSIFYIIYCIFITVFWPSPLYTETSLTLLITIS